MTDHSFRVLLWKEYRALRGFFFGLLAISCVLPPIATGQVVVPFGSGNFLLPIVMAAFFALGALASAFAGELEDQTVDFLHHLSANPRMVALAKLLVCSIAVGLFASILMLVAFIAAGRGLFDRLDEISWWGSIVFVVELSAWSMFFSLKSRRTLNAVLLAGVVAIGFAFIISRVCAPLYSAGVFSRPGEVAWFQKLLFAVQPLEREPISFGLFSSSLTIRIFLAVLLLAYDVVASFKWMNSGAADRSATDAWWKTAAGVKRQKPPVWRGKREFQRLLWQEFHQAGNTRWLLLASAVVAAVAGFLLRMSDNFAVFSVMFMTTTCGACAFQGESTDTRSRFLADRGIAPRKLWAAKETVWLGMATVLQLIAFAATVFLFLLRGAALLRGGNLQFDLPSDQTESWLAWPALYLLASLVGFGCGQFASVIFARPIPAIALGLFMSGAVNAIGGLVLGITMSPTVLSCMLIPLGVALFSATYCRSQGWLLERDGKREWFKLGLPVVAAATLMAGMLAAYRVAEVPAPPRRLAFTPEHGSMSLVHGKKTGLKTEVYVSGDDKASLETAREIVEIYRGIWRNDKRTSVLDLESIENWAAVPPDTKAWFEARKSLIEKVAKLAVAERCRVFERPDQVRIEEVDQFGFACAQLGEILILDAMQLNSQQHYDRALERYRQALALSHLAYQQPSVSNFRQALKLERIVASQIQNWSLFPNQSATNLQEGRSLLSNSRWRYFSPPVDPKTGKLPKEWLEGHVLTDAIDGQWALLNSELTHDWHGMVKRQSGARGKANWLLGLPTEKWRFTRMIEYLFSEQGNFVYEYTQNMGYNRFVSDSVHDQLRDNRNGRVFDRLSWTTPVADMATSSGSARLLIHSHLAMEASRRAALLTIALCERRLTEKQFPRQLDELLGKEINELPFDPWTGQLFGYEPDGFVSQVKFSMPKYAIAPKTPLLWIPSRNRGAMRAVKFDDKVKNIPFWTERQIVATDERDESRGWGGVAFLLRATP